MKRFSDSEKLPRGERGTAEGKWGQREGSVVGFVFLSARIFFFLAKSAAKCLAEYFKCTRSCCSCSCSPRWRCRRSRRVVAFPLRRRQTQTTTTTATATIINDGYFIIVELELELELRLQFGQRIRRSRKRISWPFLIVAVAAGVAAGAEAGAVAGADAVNPSKS